MGACQSLIYVRKRSRDRIKPNRGKLLPRRTEDVQFRDWELRPTGLLSELWGPKEFVEYTRADRGDIVFTGEGKALNRVWNVLHCDTVVASGPHLNEVPPTPDFVLVEGKGGGGA